MTRTHCDEIASLVYGINSISTKENPFLIKTKPTLAPSFEIQSVLSNHNKNAFTVVWTDGTHTTVHCQTGDDWDDEKALAMCFTKKALGNKGNFNDKFNDALNNKMKTINKKEEPKKDLPCLAEAVQKMSEAANAITSSAKEMQEAMHQMVLPDYEIFLESAYAETEGEKIYTAHSIEEIHKFVKENSVERRFGYYYRVWDSPSRKGIYIDFGSHTSYYYVSNITCSEYYGK